MEREAKETGYTWKERLKGLVILGEAKETGYTGKERLKRLVILAKRG